MSKLWHILRQPSDPNEPPYNAGATAAWHVLAAMPFGTAIELFWPLGAVGAFAFGFMVYWLLKEAGDLRRGGGFADGIADATFVALGLWAGWVIGPAFWWPLLVVNAVVIVYFAALVVRRQ